MTEKNLDRILTISAEAYCESVGRKMADYETQGFHKRGGGIIGPRHFAHTEFPEAAEVIVGFNAAVGEDGQWYLTGTALIPRYK